MPSSGGLLEQGGAGDPDVLWLHTIKGINHLLLRMHRAYTSNWNPNLQGNTWMIFLNNHVVIPVYSNTICMDAYNS
jgi:hypothetical protein